MIECISAVFGKNNSITIRKPDYYETGILIPAHNEEIEIKATVERIVEQLNTGERIVVVADNCTDSTAEIAHKAGATVIERQDLEYIGKGYALDYGLQFFAENPPDVVIFVDADCKVHPEAISYLSQKAIATHKPVQAIYLMEKSATLTPQNSISAFAFKVKNLVRPQGLANLGQPCLLTGTGMAFSWSVIQNVDLASGNLVEDMKLALDLALAGYPPVFCPQSYVTGSLPQQKKAVTSQRTRWEHGHLKTILTYVPRLLSGAIWQKRFDLLVMALDLSIPPLSLFVVLWLGTTVISIIAIIIGASWIPSLILVTAGVAISTAILTAWSKFGYHELPLITLISIPFYILGKIPLYIKFIIQPQSQWIRTERKIRADS
ncbi:glycosyltransferase family 2 protein [Myxosarcina sp. GI1(2024)]